MDRTILIYKNKKIIVGEEGVEEAEGLEEGEGIREGGREGGEEGGEGISSSKGFSKRRKRKCRGNSNSSR